MHSKGYISFDIFETLFLSDWYGVEKKAWCVCHRVEALLVYSQRCDLSVVEIYIFFQTIELSLYQSSIVDAMRMYLGRISTAVLLPSCHPHCLVYLAFMYGRTKYISPVIFFSLQRRCDIMFDILLFIYFQSTKVIMNRFVVLLVLSVPFIDALHVSPTVGSAFIWFKHLLFKKSTVFGSGS